MPLPFLEKRQRLADPVATTGNRTYLICSQNGLFPDPWGGHVPHEMWGLWNHPIKLLDGFWFAVRPAGSEISSWLVEAEVCRVFPTHTEFEYEVGSLRVLRRDFAPDGIEGFVVELAISKPRKWSAALELTAVLRSDLRPAWLGEEVGMQDHPDRATVDEENRLIFEDSGNPWAVAIGASAPPVHILRDEEGDPQLLAFQHTAGEGTTASMTFRLEFNEKDELRLLLFIAGSSVGREEATTTLQRLQAQHSTLWAQKQALYRGIDNNARLHSPDALLDDAFRWSKFNCQMLAREVAGLGAGVGAGLPTYPWWFGIDSEYSVPPMLQAGLFDLTKETLRLLRKASLQANPGEPGRVIHELSTTGIVYNKGNLVETPAFTQAVYQAWLWTGDERFLRDMYPFCKQGILDYALGQMDADGDLCPSGRSIMETHEMHAGFEVIDVAAYTWQALQALAHMAHAAGDPSAAPEYARLAEELGQRIREEWWMEEEGLFADVRASVAEVQEVLRRIEKEILPRDRHRVPEEYMAYLHGLFGAALAQRSNGPQDVDLPWLLRHWVTMCPMEVGLATPQQAERAFARLESPEFSGEHGMYLHPTRHDVMSINTAILAGAQAAYGRVDPARDTLHRLAETLPLHMPGAISEALPDQWCFMQLWSALGPISPVVDVFFGIQPCAAEKRLRVAPHLPTAWDRAALKGLRVGSSAVSVEVERSPQGYTVEVDADETFALEAGCVAPRGAQLREVTLNGQPAAWEEQAANGGVRVLVKTQTPANIQVWWDG